MSSLAMDPAKLLMHILRSTRLSPRNGWTFKPFSIRYTPSFIALEYKIQGPILNCILNCVYVMQHKFDLTRAFKGVANKGVGVDLMIFDISKNLPVPNMSSLPSSILD
jgi:hypothetical protein